MPRFAHLICLALLLPGAAQANDLLRTYDLAVRNDSTLRAAAYARDAALEAYPKARSLLLPQISSDYTYAKNYANATVTYADPLTGETVPLSRKIRGADRNLSVTLTQPVFSLEAWYRLKQADTQTALAKLNYRTGQQNLVLRVAEAYFGVLGAGDAWRSASAEQDALAQQLELATQHLAVGLSSITDTQEVQARYDLSVATELSAEQTLTEAQEKLVEIIREPLTALDDEAGNPQQAQARAAPLSPRLALLRPEIPLPIPQPADVTQWVSHAKSDNPDVIAALLDFRVADRGVDVNRAKRLPTLTGNVAYADTNSKSGSFPYKADGTTVGFGVKLPIFSGGSVQSDIRQAAAIRDQRKTEYEGAQRQAERTIRTAYQAVIIGKSRIFAYKQAVTSSRTALQASETGLQIGTRTAIDVLNAQQQRYAAERNYAQSRYDYLLAILRLKFAAGLLSTRDLAEIDALLEKS